MAARNVEKLEEVAAEIRAQGGEAFVVDIDLARRDSIKDAFARVAKEFGRVDILVNNAGDHADGLALRMKQRRLGRGDCDQPDRRVSLHSASACKA